MRRVSGVDYLTTLEELVDPTQTAVMVIDMQNDHVSPKGGHAGAGTDISAVAAIVPRIQQLLKTVRNGGIPVTYAEYIMHDRRGAALTSGPNLYPYLDTPYVPELAKGSWGAQTLDALAPQAGDIIIHKTRGSAMHNSILADILNMRGIRSLIITGIQTDGAVLETAVDTVQHGYYAVVIQDCVSSFNSQGDQAALAWMDTRFPVFNLQDVLTAW